jgi:outer membrane biosynthesis protein TonB
MNRSCIKWRLIFAGLLFIQADAYAEQPVQESGNKNISGNAENNRNEVTPNLIGTAESEHAPRKTKISSGADVQGYSTYYEIFRRRVERFGSLNFPRRDGKNLYGDVVLFIPIYHDGNLYMDEGGPRVVQTSGNEQLDRAALHIVRRASPFGPFPPRLRSTDGADVWEMLTVFSFGALDTLKIRLSEQLPGNCQHCFLIRNQK